MYVLRREVTTSSSAAEFIEASLDLRDSRADFAAFHLSLLVVKTFVICDNKKHDSNNNINNDN